MKRILLAFAVGIVSVANAQTSWSTYSISDNFSIKFPGEVAKDTKPDKQLTLYVSSYSGCMFTVLQREGTVPNFGSGYDAEQRLGNYLENGIKELLTGHELTTPISTSRTGKYLVKTVSYYSLSSGKKTLNKAKVFSIKRNLYLVQGNGASNCLSLVDRYLSSIQLK